jgi:hypothetical protein
VARLAVVLIFLLSPLALLAQKEDKERKLTDDEKIELIRGLSAEYATLKVYLPRSKRPLRFNSDGTWSKQEWLDAGIEFGPVAKVGDLIQVTKIDINSDDIVLQINGGLNTKGKWYERIEGGTGTGGGTRPVNPNGASLSAGTAIAVHFPGRVPPIAAADMKKIIAPVMDFDKHSVTTNYFDTLPPEVQAAIKEKRAIVGMDREQVVLAMGHARDRLRETKDGLDTEDWIYGYPPGKITFITFANGKVIKIKDTYAGLGGSTAPPLKPPQ